jgi:hypothetical protein
VLKQLPLQGCNGATHVNPQVEAAQVATAPTGAGQTLPQAPQSSGVVARSTQAPLHGVKPAEQDVAQPLTVHTCAALHVVLQSPQWLESAARSTQTPLQSVYPVAQAYPQLLETHVAAAFNGGVQMFPQAPQFFTSASSGMQAPLHGL